MMVKLKQVSIVVLLTIVGSYIMFGFVIPSLLRGQLCTGDARKIVQCPALYTLPLNKNDFKQEGACPSKDNRTDYNVIILTPFADSVKRLGLYFQMLCSLTYPHERISIALGQDANPNDSTSHQVDTMISMFRPSFRDITFYRLEHGTSNVTHRHRHDKSMQRVRRRHMSLSRNELLFRAMKGDHDWVIWLDVDLRYIPPNLIQLLLSPNQPIIAPACVQYQPFQTYDRNIWRETGQSRDHIADQKAKYGEDFLMIEYTKDTLRTRIVDLRHEGKVVPLDGVGGCCLLVRASCHRQGLIFPPFVFDSHIETEGLAKMATKMGFPIYGLPFVQVFHDMAGMYAK